MNKKYDIVIVGGGFAGIIVALNFCKSPYKVLVLERNDRVCKKVASTGNGRGNISNMSISPEFYHGDKSIVENILNKYGRDNLISFFNKLGLLTVVENERIYPSSMQASSVSDLMRLKLDNSANIEVKYGYIVDQIDFSDKKFTINKQITCDKLVICAGGKSMKNFGTDGSIFPVLNKMGIMTTQFSPSLVQMKTQTDKIRGLRGIKQRANITLLDGKDFVKTFSGDLLFTDSGISGDSVFRLSAYLSEVKDPVVKIEFVPEYSYEQLESFLIEKSDLSYINNEHLPVGIVNNRLGLMLLKCAGLSVTDKATRQSAIKLCKAIKDFKLQVKGTLGYDFSQVTHGGVDIKCLDENLQSKKYPNLYFAGEVLNVDGDCGGYNLQWAFSSAMAVSGAIYDSYKR